MSADIMIKTLTKYAQNLYIILHYTRGITPKRETSGVKNRGLSSFKVRCHELCLVYCSCHTNVFLKYIWVRLAEVTSSQFCLEK